MHGKNFRGLLDSPPSTGYLTNARVSAGFVAVLIWFSAPAGSMLGYVYTAPGEQSGGRTTGGTTELTEEGKPRNELGKHNGEEGRHTRRK